MDENTLKTLNKPVLPKFQRRRDNFEYNSIKEIIDFLTANSIWNIKNKLVGYYDVSSKKIIVYTIKGKESYILFTKNSSNIITFPLIEAFSLMCSGRLIVLARDSNDKIFNISNHLFLDVVLRNSTRYNFDDIIKYQIFTRKGTKRSTNVDSTTKKECCNTVEENSYKDKCLKSLGLIETPVFDLTSKFKCNFPVKFSNDIGFPKYGHISFLYEGDEETLCHNTDNVLIYPVTLSFIIQISKEPGRNWCK